jgi:hypothetical protein
MTHCPRNTPQNLGEENKSFTTPTSFIRMIHAVESDEQTMKRHFENFPASADPYMSRAWFVFKL